MLKEKAGVIAGQIWEALNETEGKTQKQLKKEAKLKADNLTVDQVDAANQQSKRTGFTHTAASDTQEHIQQRRQVCSVACRD